MARYRSFYGDRHLDAQPMPPTLIDTHTHTHTPPSWGRRPRAGCTMMDEAAVTPFFAEAVVRSPLEEAWYFPGISWGEGPKHSGMRASCGVEAWGWRGGALGFLAESGPSCCFPPLQFMYTDNFQNYISSPIFIPKPYIYTNFYSTWLQKTSQT